jgi:hypothetical protein
MATQTEYQIPAAGGTDSTAPTVTPGTVTRQWMLPTGIVLNEVVTGGGGGGGGHRPVVQTCG